MTKVYTGLISSVDTAVHVNTFFTFFTKFNAKFNATLRKITQKLRRNVDCAHIHIFLHLIKLHVGPTQHLFKFQFLSSLPKVVIIFCLMCYCSTHYNMSSHVVFLYCSFFIHVKNYNWNQIFKFFFKLLLFGKKKKRYKNKGKGKKSAI